jgi:hypothetical protein
MPAWLAFLFGVIAGALLIAAGVLFADLRRERRIRREAAALVGGPPIVAPGQPSPKVLERLRAAAARVERTTSPASTVWTKV